MPPDLIVPSISPQTDGLTVYSRFGLAANNILKGMPSSILPEIRHIDPQHFATNYSRAAMRSPQMLKLTISRRSELEITLLHRYSAICWLTVVLPRCCRYCCHSVANPDCQPRPPPVNDATLTARFRPEVGNSATVLCNVYAKMKFTPKAAFTTGDVPLLYVDEVTACAKAQKCDKELCYCELSSVATVS